MRRNTNVKNRGYQNLLMEFFFIQNAHPWRLTCFIRRLLPLKLTQFINSLLKSINFALSNVWTCHKNFMVLKRFIFGKVPIHSCGISDLVLMCCNFGGWFWIGHIIFCLIFMVTSSNLFSSPLWKVTTSSRLIVGCFSRFGLLTWLTSTFFSKTCFIFFFIFLVNIVGIL